VLNTICYQKFDIVKLLLDAETLAYRRSSMTWQNRKQLIILSGISLLVCCFIFGAMQYSVEQSRTESEGRIKNYFDNQTKTAEASHMAARNRAIALTQAKTDYEKAQEATFSAFMTAEAISATKTVQAVIPAGDIRLLQQFVDKCKLVKSVNSNGSFTQNPGIHPTILLYTYGELSYHSWNEKIPSHWRPTSFAETELLVCLGEQKQIQAKGCSYTPSGYINRTQKQLSVNLIDATNGTLIAHKDFVGSVPSCPPVITDSTSSRGLMGADVAWGSVIDWLKPYVEPS
jgi:hypothetical protein